MKNISATARILQSLVRIPSVNPEGNPGIKLTGEEACAEWIGQFLKKAGAKVQFQTVEPGRPNVIGIFKGSKPTKRRILLAPHTDTVSVAGMTIDPFSGKISQGRLWGRGASDTKGPMAAMLQALREFSRTPGFRNSSLEITFAGLMGEEAGDTGAYAWVKKCPRYDLAIIGEPTDLKIVYAHKGAAWLKIETSGLSAHASLPHKGKNAIYAMTPVLRYFRDDLPGKINKIRHPDLGSSTVSLTTIEGGSKANIIPESCHATVDLRFVPGLTIKFLLQQIRSDFKKLGIAAKVTEAHSSFPLNTDPTHPLIEKILPCTKGLTTAPWFCDAAVFAERGIASIALGPGSIQQAHTANEFIKLSDLEKGRECYLSVLNALAG